MLKIGDFAGLAHVTVKDLRHYGRMGLLEPAWIDRFTGYRYYTLQQLPRLNRLHALKDLGFSLEQIAKMLDEDVPVEQLRAMLTLKQSELLQHLQVEQARLAQVEARLKQIEREGTLPAYDVLVKSVSPLLVAVLRQVLVEPEQVPPRAAQLCRELTAWLQAAGLHLSGPWLAIYHHQDESEVEVELAVGIEGELHHPPRLDSQKQLPYGRVSLHALPAIPLVISTLHPGDHDTLPQAHAALYGWAEANGYRIIGPARELYLQDQGSGGPIPGAGGTPVTEVQYPVERVAAWLTLTPIASDKEKQYMEPKIMSRPAFTVVGLPYVGKNQNQEISTLWGEFNQQAGQIGNIKEGAAFGICTTLKEAPDGVFEYVASLEVSSLGHIPEGMVVRNVPERRYAAFAHVGPLEKLHDTYNFIYQTWLPQSGYQLDGNFDMEVYTDEFKDFSPDSVFYIYVPIK